MAEQGTADPQPHQGHPLPDFRPHAGAVPKVLRNQIKAKIFHLALTGLARLALQETIRTILLILWIEHRPAD